MGKMKELATALDGIADCGNAVTEAANELNDLLPIIESLSNCGKAIAESADAVKALLSKVLDASEQNTATLVKGSMVCIRSSL